MSADEIMANLEAAKEKLNRAKADGMNVVASVAQARSSVSHALGRAGSRSPLIAQMAAKEKALLAKIMAIDALVVRIDRAIQRARDVGAAAGGAATEPPS